MHSSTMRTARFNGHLRGVVWPGGLSCQGVSAQGDGVHRQTQRQTPPDPEADTLLDPEADTPYPITCWDIRPWTE